VSQTTIYPHRHDPTSTREMVVIGLLDLPPEIQLHIAESVKGKRALRALSVTSRSLCSIAQSLLFKDFKIALERRQQGSLEDMLANPQICVAIRSLVLSSYGPLSANLRDNEKKISLIKELLPKMVRLRVVSISRVRLSRMFMDTLLEMAAKIPLEVTLHENIYPRGMCPMPNAPLRISYLNLTISDYNPSINVYLPLLCACASSAALTSLHLTTSGDVLMKLAGICPPFLHDLGISLRQGDDNSEMSAAAFLAAQKKVRRLWISGKVGPVPRRALPNLQELHSPIEVVKQLVPGRPVEAITISSFDGYGRNWCGKEIIKSAVTVRKICLKDAIFDTRLVEQMVTGLPYLEILWLSMYDDVSGAFALYL